MTACHHVWSVADAAPDCSDVFYECVVPGCKASRCVDESGACADIATDDAVVNAVEQRIERQERRSYGF